MLLLLAVLKQSGAVEEAPPLPPPPPQEAEQEEQEEQNAADYGSGDGDGQGLGASDGALPPLPAECGAEKHPVVVLRSVYTKEESDADPHFFDDLEVHVWGECFLVS